MTSDPLMTFHDAGSSGRATLTLRPEARGEHPVNPLLLGEFCEHLGSNIYQGMEAQILHNPTFGQLTLNDQQLAHVVRRGGGPDAEALAASYRDGAAIGWVRIGPAADVRLSPDVGPHGTRAQRFETSGADQGIGQWLHLPLGRTRRYEYRLVARAARPCRLKLTMAATRPDGAVEPPLACVELQLSEDWTTLSGALQIDDATPDALLLCSLTTPEPANVVLDRVLLYPDDQVGGADPVILAMLKEARLPLLRWPGGNFVSGYHWRDGVGPVDERPTLPNPAWAGVLEPNLFGTDEFMAYCRAVDCEPLICVNAGDGTPDEAAAWVEYCNGPPDTPMGRRRAANGYPEPYGVRYWEVGNELYGRWQVGWTTPGGNVDRFGRFSAAMRRVDPSIRLLACGALHQGGDAEWNRRLCAETGGAADCQTHHILIGGQVDATTDPKELYHAFMGYPIHMDREYRHMKQRMLDAGIARPRLAITELQLFARFHDDGRGPTTRDDIPTPDTIAEALYLTLIVNACIRLGDLVELLTHSATVNHGGGLRKRSERVWANPVHHAHAMLAPLAGGTPLGLRLECGSFSTATAFGGLPVVVGASDLDASAALTADGRRIVLMLVHRSATAGPIDLTLDTAGLAPDGPADVLTLTGDTLNDRNTFEQPDRIVPVASSARIVSGRMTLSVGPFSLTRVALSAR